jgi:hypothetical protein
MDSSISDIVKKVLSYFHNNNLPEAVMHTQNTFQSLADHGPNKSKDNQSLQLQKAIRFTYQIEFNVTQKIMYININLEITL